jgi:hypothetical protein
MSLRFLIEVWQQGVGEEEYKTTEISDIHVFAAAPLTKIERF